MRTQVACLLVVAMAAAGVAFVVPRLGSRAEIDAGRSVAVVWLPRADTHAQAQAVREQCGAAPGVASVSELSRSRAFGTANEFVFSISMRWRPDDVRSNPLLDCLNDNARIDHYAIPI
jgi:hypothetical protein